VNNNAGFHAIPGSSTFSEGFGISSDGAVMCGRDGTSASSNQAFVWQDGDVALTLLGTLAGDTQSCAIAVNADKIAAGYSSDGTTERAVIWDTSGTWDATGQPLLLLSILSAAGVDVSDWTSLTRVATMSDDGETLGGWGVWAADGSKRGFVVVPPGPCPDPFADADGDGDVDQKDFAVIQVCLTGIDGGVLPGCECFNTEPGLPAPDNDVDHDDFVKFKNCASGPNVPADSACDD
jgi:probable HAF family extracellular repeat protein